MSSWHCFVEERAEQMRMLRRGAAALVLIAPWCALVTDPWRARLEDEFVGSENEQKRSIRDGGGKTR